MLGENIEKMENAGEFIPSVEAEIITEEQAVDYWQNIGRKYKDFLLKIGLLRGNKILADFCGRLEKKYGEQITEKCLAFHKIQGSTPFQFTKKDLTWDSWIFDFKGEDSIEKFLDDLLEKQES